MKKKISLLLAFIMLFSLCACGAGEKSARTAAAPAAGAPAELYFSADTAVAEESAAYGGLSVSNSAADLAGGEDGTQPPGEKPDKIIYSAEATVETTDFDATLARVGEMVEKYGGWTESSSVNGNNYYDQSRGRSSTRSAHYSLRVPSQHFETIMSSLSTLGNIPYSYTYTENISARYYDTRARLTAYETQEQRLLEMLEIAETVEDIITIEEKLTELRYNIESLQTSLTNWDRQVDYSSIYLNIQEVEEYTPEAALRPSYGEKLLTAFKDGISGFVGFVGDLFIWIVGALPVLIILGAAAALGIPAVKRRRAKKKPGEKTEDREG